MPVFFWPIRRRVVALLMEAVYRGSLELYMYIGLQDYLATVNGSVESQLFLTNDSPVTRGLHLIGPQFFWFSCLLALLATLYLPRLLKTSPYELRIMNATD